MLSVSSEPKESNEIRTAWPEISSDVAHRKRLARRVANRAGDHKDQLLATVSSNLADLAGRIAAREIDDERRELESRARDENLSDRITSETEDWRRSKRTIEDMIGELQRSLDSSDRRAEILEREMLRLRNENTELIEVLEGVFGTLDLLSADVSSVRGTVEEQNDSITAGLGATDGRAEELENELQTIRTANDELVIVLDGVFGSLDVLNEDVSSVRATVDEQNEAMETLVSAADVEAIAAELERRYIELRELVEEARVTAEKASDRADYASDGVSVVQADVEEELEDLKERLRHAPSEAELRSEFAAVARREVRDQADQLEAIRAELDHRLSNRVEPETATGRRLRRWQQWIDLTDSADKD